MPCQKPMVANSDVAGSAVNRLISAGLGRSVCTSIVGGQPGPQRLGRGLHGPVAGEQGQGASAGRADQGGQLVVERGLVRARAGIGQVGGAVEQRVGLVVERAAHIQLGVGPRIEAQPFAQPGGDGGAGQHHGGARPTARP